MVDGALDVEAVRPADHLIQRPEAHLRHQFAHLLGDESEVVLDELRLSREALSELGVLGCDSDRTGVEMTDSHHDASRHDERCRREPVLLGAQQGGDDDVTPGLHLPVDLDHDPVA